MIFLQIFRKKSNNFFIVRVYDKNIGKSRCKSSTASLRKIKQLTVNQIRRRQMRRHNRELTPIHNARLYSIIRLSHLIPMLIYLQPKKKQQKKKTKKKNKKKKQNQKQKKKKKTNN